MIINCIDTGFKGLYTLINTINMSDFLIFKSECQAGKGVFMFKYNKDVIPTDCEPGVTRKILCYSDDLMMCEITFKKGSKGNFHKHEHLQITYIAKGSFEFTIGGETKIVNQGDSVYLMLSTALLHLKTAYLSMCSILCEKIFLLNRITINVLDFRPFSCGCA